MKVCMFLLSFYLFTTLPVKRRSRIYPVEHTELEQTEIAETGTDDIIQVKKHRVLVRYKCGLYTSDDDVVASSQKKFIAAGIPEYLDILILKSFLAGHLERCSMYLYGCRPSHLFNKGSPDKKLLTGFFSFYLKNCLFPFLLFSPDTAFSFKAVQQLFLQNIGGHYAPFCTIVVINPMPTFLLQGYNLFCSRQETTLISKDTAIPDLIFWFCGIIRSALTRYCPP